MTTNYRILLSVMAIALLCSSFNVFAKKGEKDPSGPLSVTITSPADGEYLKVAQAQVTGTVSETKNLINVTVNGVTAFIDGSSFSATVPLIEGDNVLVANSSYKGNKGASTSSTVIVDTKPPAVVSAISISNTEVLLQFTEAVQGGETGAESHAVYKITADTTNSNLPVVDAIFWTQDNSTVLLTTLSQANSSYKLTATGIKDLAGNPISERVGWEIDPSSTTFVGTDPSGDQIADTDEDGLYDHVELTGWEVIVTQGDGTVTGRFVSSDPQLPDTDGDAVGDYEEQNARLDPRNADTDGDLLSDDQEWNSIFSDPTAQDTDEDGLNDGTEFNFFRTSPLLDDTDGDQLLDFEEVLAGNRNPLLSDLPSPRIRVGSVNLQLDTRLSFTDEEGRQVSEEKSTDTTLTRSENETFATSNEESTKNTLQFSEKLSKEWSLEPSISVEFEAEQGSERGSTFTTSESSGRSSEEAYHNSLTTSTAHDVTKSVTREVLDAAIKVDLTIENDNDIPFSIGNLEVTAQSQYSLDRSRVIPIGSLVPENPELDFVNIGALGDPARGPFIFKTVSVFPQQVQELMKNPRGLIVQLANFDIIDEEGRNFAYVSQDVLDRTAGITFDLGDGRTESYRVATASAHDRDTGVPQGISMEYAFEIIGLSRYDYIRDGGNGLAETQAIGDDVQVYALDEQIEPGVKVITAGDNGVLDSSPLGDDVIEEPDYEIPYIAATIQDGGNGIAETTAEDGDEQVVVNGETVYKGQVVVSDGAVEGIVSTPGGDDKLVPAHRVLARFADVETNEDEKKFWILFTSNDRPGIDLNKQVIRAGEQYDFAYVQDKDGDGVWAREEYLYGSSDLRTNSDGCDLDPAPDPCDTLNDHQEIREGWRVQLKGSPQANPVFPNPVQGDSDRDTLTDDQEKACALDPRQRDTDLDGLTDWEELNGKLLEDGDADGNMVSRDPDTDAIRYTIWPYDGGVGNYSGDVPHEALQSCNDAGFNGFATDPLNDDTDGDLLNDLAELRVGLNPNDPSDGDLYLDDDGDGVPNKIEREGFFTVVNGAQTTSAFTSNPNQTDTDQDGLPDLLEHYIESNPLSADTDGDGITDFNEYKGGGEACVTENTDQPCVAFSDLSENNYYSFVRDCDDARVCDNNSIEQGLVDNGSKQYGTNLNEADSDFDGLDDKDEIDGTDITVNGSSYHVTSDPLSKDTDGDGLSDSEERDLGTDPRNTNTDGDGYSDGTEKDLGTNPTKRDVKIKIVLTSLVCTNSDDGAGGDHIEPEWEASIQENEGGWTKKIGYSKADTGDVGVTDKLLEDVVLWNSRILVENDNSLGVRLSGYEDDAGDDDEYYNTITVTWKYGDIHEGDSVYEQSIDGGGTLETTITTTVYQ